MTRLSLSPVDLTLLAVAVNEKIAKLDEKAAALRIERERLGGFVMDGEEVNLVIRANYATLIRRIEQALDVPMADSESLRVALAIERISADFTAYMGDDDEEMPDHNPEGDPTLNGAFR